MKKWQDFDPNILTSILNIIKIKTSAIPVTEHQHFYPTPATVHSLLLPMLVETKLFLIMKL